MKKIIVISLIIILAGCSSAPKVPEPVGEIVPINSNTQGL